MFKSVKTKNVRLQLKPANLPVAPVIYDTIPRARADRAAGSEGQSLYSPPALYIYLKVTSDRTVSFSQSCLELFFSPVLCLWSIDAPLKKKTLFVKKKRSSLVYLNLLMRSNENFRAFSGGG